MANGAITEAFPHDPGADSFDLRRAARRVIQACDRHRRLVLGTMVMTFVAMLIYIVVWPPVYVAKVEMLGESDKDISREGFYASWAIFRKDQLSDEVQLFTADPVLAEVIHRLDLKDGDVYHSPAGFLGYLWTQSWPGQWYRDARLWLFPPAAGPFRWTRAQMDAARTLDDLKMGVKLDSVMETNVGNLTVSGPTPRVAEIANTIVQVYEEYSRRWHAREAEAAYDALSVEAARTRTAIDSLEGRMRQYYANNNVMLSFDKDKLDLNQAATLQAAIGDLETSVAAGENSLTQLNKELAREPEHIVSLRVVQRSPLVDALKTALQQLQIARKQALLHYREDSPEVAEIDRQITIQEDQLRKEPLESVSERSETQNTNRLALEARKHQIATDLQGERASLAVRQRELGAARTLLLAIPEKMMEVHDLDREHTALEAKYGALEDKLTMAAVSRATSLSAPSSIRVIAEAVPPGRPAWPKPMLLLPASLAVGLLAGVVAAIVADLLFGRVQRERLEHAGAEQPLYAVVGPPRGALIGPGRPPRDVRSSAVAEESSWRVTP